MPKVSHEVKFAYEYCMCKHFNLIENYVQYSGNNLTAPIEMHVQGCTLWFGNRSLNILRRLYKKR